ncbi:TFIID-31kDa-domain-containing protein [Ophiobolus disseminans]|uniref:TFIID-31kDa-domain-containing protein n=1 Tax=Ophiobolus disseminans TaxID=1469910 RepID=A0A6A6ZHG6_9PLEO|nr:TFIID-31kDa-domain-containing protein [Ophiobolus disseminans]
MASPAAEPLANGISTPPATTAGNTNASPPTQTQSSTQPNTQSQPSFAAPTSLTADTTGKKPRDARLIHLLLAQMGVHVYSERVPLQLLDFAYRYTSSILSDAQSYEPPAPSHTGVGKKRRNADAEGDGEGVSIAALRTAVAARAQGQFQAWLPKEFMGEIAMERNRVALPRVEREFGVRLPPERYCFTGTGRWGVWIWGMWMRMSLRMLWGIEMLARPSLGRSVRRKGVIGLLEAFLGVGLLGKTVYQSLICLIVRIYCASSFYNMLQ